MRVAWVGLGKLGSVCAAVLRKHGHDVVGYDPYSTGALPSYEADTAGLVPTPLFPLETVVQHVRDQDEDSRRGLVFVSVQTPHAPQYGGEAPMPAERRDFEYGFLVQSCREVFAQCRKHPDSTFTVVIVSTVLPGTYSKYIRPMVPANVNVVYNPFFIAMGTTVADFLNPEFVLLGADDPSHVDGLRELYGSVHSKPLEVMSIESAELTKVAYNVFISSKIVFANTMMEICHKTGADVDEVSGALAKATDRVASGAYLRGGMGDGGHCHPRDLIAMSWLADRLDLSVDLLGFLAAAREKQSQWLAREALKWKEQTGLRIAVLGRAYKPESPLQGGSPALLLSHDLDELDPDSVHFSWDPHCGDSPMDFGKHVYVIATKHEQFRHALYPAGSVIIDPFGYMPDKKGCTVVRVGRKS